MTPTPPKTTWQVYTTGELFRPLSSQTSWGWVAHGPRGSESGVEATAEQALDRAHGAFLLLRDSRELS